MTVDESMSRHPSWQSVGQDALDAQALELANRHRRVEESKTPLRSYGWVDEKHHEMSTGPRRVWVNVIAPFLGALLLFLLVFGTAVLGEIAGGWPT